MDKATDPPRPHRFLRIRVAEWVVLAFLTYTVFASLLFPFDFRERSLVLALNLVAIGIIVLMGRIRKPSRWLSETRNWIPIFYILLAYRESGLFLKADPTHHLDFIFIKFDRALLQNTFVANLLSSCSPWLEYYLELSYLLCYPLVPLGLAALYLGFAANTTHPSSISGQASIFPTVIHHDPKAQEKVVDHYWTTVLLAAFACYVTYPLFPLTPPRVLFHDLPGPAVEPLLRKMNFWILDQYSVQACIFPSGHVAAVTAVALAVRAHLTRGGILFIISAASVAIATVYGRYHYTADAIAGVLVGVVAFLVSSRIHKF